MLAAGGLKLKALTALYYGLPMISTSSGVDGLEVEDNFDCIVENRLDLFPEHMKRLCDARLNREISTNARQTFLKYYSRDSVFAEYDNLFG
jgi:glycosyltransferase involved in cell wall biosynthesis